MLRGTEGGDNYIIAGRYDDRVVRTPDGWRIAHRVLTVDWTEGNPAVVRPTRSTEAPDMRFALSTSPQRTTWDWLREVWKRADDIELFESGWTFDHFYPIFGDPTDDCLEGWMSLAALLHETQRLRGGVLVTGMLYRHPAVLANMAATLDVTSGGRLELGVGAGWNEEECEAYGIDLGTHGRALRSLRGGRRGPAPAAHPGPRRLRRAAGSG